jgi:Terminase large subunit, T4likevirus-type, N-terminal
MRTMTDLDRLRSALLAFSVAIGQPLTRWQADALSLECRTTVIQAPRQSGKSRALGVLALWWSFRRPGQRVLIVSAGEAAARRLLAEAADVAQRSPLLAGSVTDESSALLTLSNGSEVRSVPASERQIRGWRVDMLLLDEAAQLDDELVHGAALPTIAASPDARVVLASSPGAQEGAFYDFAASASESVAVSRWSLEEATWIAPEVVEQAREQLPPAVFAREFLGEFTDTAEEVVIERKWIEAAQARSLRPGPVLFGVDVARGGDETVAMRLAGGVARVAWASHGADLMATAGKIAAMVRAEDGPAPTTWIDVTGLGYGIFDRCAELGLPVQPFVAGARAERPERWLNLRAQAWFTAREAFRLGEIDLDPEDKLLASQLAGQRFEITSGGQLQIAAKASGKSPDRADALVIAIHGAAQRYRGEQITRFIEEARRGPEPEFVPVELDRDWLSATPELGPRRRSWRENLDADLPTFYMP